MARGDKPYLRKSTDRKAQIRKAFVQFSGLICALRYVDFSGKVYHPEPPHAQSLFLFPIVFGINLIHFFDGKNKLGLGRIWSFVLSFRSLVARLVPFERGGIADWRSPWEGEMSLTNFPSFLWYSKRGGTKRAKQFLATESVNSLRILAPQWWPLGLSVNGERGSVKKETRSANFWQGKV